MVKKSNEYNNKAPKVTPPGPTDSVIMPGDLTDMRVKRHLAVKTFDAIWASLHAFYQRLEFNRLLIKQALQAIPQRKPSTTTAFEQAPVHQRLGGSANYTLDRLKDDLKVWFMQIFKNVKRKAKQMVGQAKEQGISDHQHQFIVDHIDNCYKDHEVEWFVDNQISTLVDQVAQENVNHNDTAALASTDTNTRAEASRALRELLRPLVSEVRFYGRQQVLPKGLSELLENYYAQDLVYRACHSYDRIHGSQYGNTVFMPAPNAATLYNHIQQLYVNNNIPSFGNSN